MNQHDKKDILFISSRGKPIIELRDCQTKLILYTESREVYRRFKDWRHCFLVAPYSQSDIYGNSHILAYDLHFYKEARRTLMRTLTKELVYGSG